MSYSINESQWYLCPSLNDYLLYSGIHDVEPHEVKMTSELIVTFAKRQLNKALFEETICLITASITMWTNLSVATRVSLN